MQPFTDYPYSYVVFVDFAGMELIHPVLDAQTMNRSAYGHIVGLDMNHTALIVPVLLLKCNL